MKNHICDIHGLLLNVKSSVNVRELEELFYGEEYGHDWVSRIVDHVLDDIFAIEELVVTSGSRNMSQNKSSVNDWSIGGLA